VLVILGVVLLGLGLWRGGLWAIAAAFGGGGLALAWHVGGRLPPGVRRGTPHLLPDSALEWLRQSHQAMGSWAIESDTHGSGSAGYHSLDPAVKFTDRRLRHIERRLVELRDRDGGGGERLEEGTLVFEALGGFVAGLMLIPSHSSDDLERAHIDLRYLLDGLTRRPIVHERAQDETPPVEASRSIALRLAYQVERVLEVHTVVALLEPGGARVAAASGGADMRLVGTLLPDDSPLGRVASGSARSMQVQGEALGDLVPDRRQHSHTQITMLHLQDQGEPIGAVAFWRFPSEPLPGAALAEVKEILHQAEPRFRTAIMLERDKKEQATDHLTGLPNRSELEGQMKRLGLAAGALIVADLDGFESLNETLGNPAGDAALVHFANTLNYVVRETDLAARTGGEEFAVWLPDTDLASALMVADRIRERFDSSSWDWQGRSWQLSASFGVAACPETGGNLDSLRVRAEEALSKAKREGRNRVVAAPVQV
jgi:diguanylate cyclase (GGDEF)-like protein